MKHAALLLLALLVMTGCRREPPLHLYDEAEFIFDIPEIELELDVIWDYEIQYDWRAEWYYGWDESESEIGYKMPTAYQIRRYHTGYVPYAPHTSKAIPEYTVGNTFRAKYEWGYWDILVWNDIHTIDQVQSLIFDEDTSPDYVTAYTNQTMHTSRYQAPRYTNSFWEPEPLFAGYTQGEEVQPDLKGFVYDEERNVYVKKMLLPLLPLTYIYLTQVIIHNNNNRVVGVDGSANLSGLARSVVLNTGIAGDDAVTVYYNVNMKSHCDMRGEDVDIIGGRMMTFGICGHNAHNITRADEVKDKDSHFMDVTMNFNNGTDSTFVFNVTDQVRKRYKGGVITVEINMDTIPIPSRSGGSAFNAVVKDYEDGGTHEFGL